MQHALADFAIRLIAGVGLTLCAMPRRAVPSPFFRIMLLLVLGLGALFTLAEPKALWLGSAICAASFVGSVFWQLERRRSGTLALGIATLLALVELVASHASGWPGSGHGGHWLEAASALASAATLGAALAGMLLGHRYLTAPGMPLAPLIHLNFYLGAAAILRFLVSAIALASGIGSLTQSTYWIFLALRWLAGILGPMIVCIMVHRILRYRNTQAATGVLFVGVILTFIGELTADLLFRTLHVPF